MPVKVLGQTISTPPSTATTIVNLVKEPSFETLNYSSAVTTASSATVYAIPGSNYWQFVANTTPSVIGMSLPQLTTVAAADGNNAFVTSPSSQNLSVSGSIQLLYGYQYGVSASTIQDSNRLDRNTAIVLKPNTTYYFGAKYRANGAGVLSPVVTVYQWEGSGQNQTNAQASETVQTGSWRTLSGSFTNSSDYKYATIRLYHEFTNSSSGETWLAWDSVWLSESATYTSTFPNPDNSTAVTAPFNDRGVTYAGAYSNSYSVRSFPGALNDLYTVPAGSSAVVSTITVSNLASRFNVGSDFAANTQTTPVRIAVLPSGATLAKRHFIVFDAPVAFGTTQTFTIGMTLAAGDKIQVSADTDNVSFTAFGNES